MLKPKRTIDGKTVLIIEKDNGSRKNEKQAVPLSYEQKSEIVLEKKYMEKKEINEKHLEAAIMNKEQIPVPDIIEIDEEVYDKLYPSNFKRTSWRIIAEPPNEKEVEYDMDSEDTNWIKEQPASCKLTPEKFEAYFEYLEENTKKKVPTFTDFHASFKTHRPVEALENVYEYWLDKRFKQSGKDLVPELKKFDKKASKKFDPYLAFRPCREKMFLRKNRQMDRENYMKMVRLREQMTGTVKEWKSYMIMKKAENEKLKSKFNNFERQYHQKTFSDPINSCMPIMNYDEVSNSFNSIKINENPEEEEGEVPTFDSLTKLHFDRKPGQRFHKALENFAEVKGQQFYETSIGSIRPRVGRGGRIIYDRAAKKSNKSPEYHEYKIINNIKLRRLDQNKFQSGSSSAFRLSNSCTHINLDDAKDKA